jgi:predicted nucleotidyltransferase
VDFNLVITKLGTRFRDAGIEYALIGGLAMAAHGIQRSTLDMDFIILLSDMDAVDGVMAELSYKLAFRSQNVSHYQSADPRYGRIDVLHAFRDASKRMVQRAKVFPVTPYSSLPVVSLEDLIGLKVQAAFNDPTRNESDWSDIREIVRHAGRFKLRLDWPLIGDYLALFAQEHSLEPLKQLYGPAD